MQCTVAGSRTVLWECLRSDDGITGIIESGYTFPRGGVAAIISLDSLERRLRCSPSTVRTVNPLSRLTRPRASNSAKISGTANDFVTL